MKRIVILIVGIAFSIACADYWYNDFKSLFYPETAIIDKASGLRSFYYSPDYLFNKGAYGSLGSLEVTISIDSLNVGLWYRNLDKKIPQNIIKAGLYNRGQKFLSLLQSAGFSDAAEYVSILKKIDTLNALEAYWGEPGKEADIPNLLVSEKELEILYGKTTLPWLKDRILYARMKALRFASNNEKAALLYENEGKNQQIGLIADMTRSLYAGIFFPTNTDQSYYEFSKMLNATELPYHGPYNVRVYNMSFNERILKLCKSNAEKADVHAIAAMQPMQNLPYHIRRVHTFNPQHKYLQLLVSRMINKYEDFYEVSKEKGRYWYSPEDSLAYILPHAALDSIVSVTLDIVKTKNVFNEPFYAQAMAHLFYTKGNIPMAKLWNSIVIENSIDQKRQKYVQELLNFLAEPEDQKLDKTMLSKLESLGAMTYGRDVHVMQVIAKGLNKYFRQDTVKAFYAMSLYAVSDTWENNAAGFKHGGWEQQKYLDTISTNTMKAVIYHLESRKYDIIDSTFMRLSNLTPDILYLAYARKLMMDDEWVKAKKYYDKVNDKYFYQRINGIDAYFGFNEKLISYEEPILWLKSHEQKPISNHRKFLEYLASIKKQVIQKPNDSKVLYDYALQQYNLSYWGSVWIFAKSHKSTDNDFLPVSNINTYYGCDNAAKTLDHAIKNIRNDDELHSKIIYLRALVEKKQAYLAVANIYPENYWELSEEQKKVLDKKAEKLIAEKYTKYGQYLLEKVGDSAYKRMIINECEDIRKLVK
jgi:hypothetical protein